MNKQLENIIEMMTAFKQEVKTFVELPSIDVIQLRANLAYEELKETEDGFESYYKFLTNSEFNEVSESEYIEEYKEILDGIIDQIVILAGTLNSYGISLGDERCSYKWNTLFNHYLNDEKFTIPKKYVFDNWNGVTNASIQIHNLITKIKESSIDSFCGYGKVDEEVIKFSHKILLHILEMANAMGLKDRKLFELLWDEIFNSNMSKLENGEPVLREDGKVLKGKDYRKPDITKVVTDYLK